jgi:hypothetical protein
MLISMKVDVVGARKETIYEHLVQLGPVLGGALVACAREGNHGSQNIGSCSLDKEHQLDRTRMELASL